MVTSLSRNGSTWCWHISWQGRVSPWLHLISQGAEVTSSPTPPGFYGPARAIPVHTGMDAGHREPCSIPSLQIVAIAVCRTSSSLDRQMGTLGSSTCDCWVQEATSRCSHTTGCSSAGQQVLQDGKSKRQRSSKTPAEQDQDQIMFTPRDAVWEAGNQRVPGHLLLLVLLLAHPYNCCMKRGGLLRVCPGVVHSNPRVFACPACACFALAPFPGREPEKGQYSSSGQGNNEPLVPGQSAGLPSQACSFLLLFLPLSWVGVFF